MGDDPGEGERSVGGWLEGLERNGERFFFLRAEGVKLHLVERDVFFRNKERRGGESGGVEAHKIGGIHDIGSVTIEERLQGSCKHVESVAAGETIDEHEFVFGNRLGNTLGCFKQVGSLAHRKEKETGGK